MNFDIMCLKTNILLLLFFSIFFSSCDTTKSEEIKIIRDIALGESITMVPGEIVRFSEPFNYELTLVSFNDYIKDGNGPFAFINFESKSVNSQGTLGIQINEDQIENGPIFFSGCTPSILGDGDTFPFLIYYLTEEIRFEEQATKFIFKSIRFKIILQSSSNQFTCTS